MLPPTDDVQSQIFHGNLIMEPPLSRPDPGPLPGRSVNLCLERIYLRVKCTDLEHLNYARILS